MKTWSNKKKAYIGFGSFMIIVFVFSVIDDNYWYPHKLGIEYPFLFILILGLLFIILNEKLHHYLNSLTKIKVGDIEFDRDITPRLSNVKKNINPDNNFRINKKLVHKMNEVNEIIRDKYQKITNNPDRGILNTSQKAKILHEKEALDFNLLTAFNELTLIIEDIQRSEMQITEENCKEVERYINDLKTELINISR